jgi:AcrR family transcriptional regulator
MGTSSGRASTSLVDRVLDGTQRCTEKWGFAKVTVDDIATESGVSRATIYRLFPGGRDVLFEALRVRELEDFFAVLRAHVEGADTLDEHLAGMLASAPGEALGQLTVEGVPRIIRFATAFIAPLAAPYLDRARSRELIDVLARLVISYFLAPSDHVDLGERDSAAAFLVPLLAPYVQSARSLDP